MATLLVITGAILLEPTWTPKLILLAVFILLTNPLSSSVVARASHKIGAEHINPHNLDELEDNKEESK
jgi:multicomponent Na+:H+ antiporter subunit G